MTLALIRSETGSGKKLTVLDNAIFVVEHFIHARSGVQDSRNRDRQVCEIEIGHLAKGFKAFSTFF